MLKVKTAVWWGALAILGYWGVKKALAASAGTNRNKGGNGNGRSHKIGAGSLGKADAYTDAFPEEGLGWTEPGR